MARNLTYRMYTNYTFVSFNGHPAHGMALGVEGTRGTACPFAHGPEELAEITRIVGKSRIAGAVPMALNIAWFSWWRINQPTKPGVEPRCNAQPRKDLYLTWPATEFLAGAPTVEKPTFRWVTWRERNALSEDEVKNWGLWWKQWESSVFWAWDIINWSAIPNWSSLVMVIVNDAFTPFSGGGSGGNWRIRRRKRTPAAQWCF